MVADYWPLLFDGLGPWMLHTRLCSLGCACAAAALGRAAGRKVDVHEGLVLWALWSGWLARSRKTRFKHVQPRVMVTVLV